MPAKNFERTVRFSHFMTSDGKSIWLPLVEVTLITATTSRVSLSLMFDTGASVTTLRADLYPLLGLQSWNQGQEIIVEAAGGSAQAYQYNDVVMEVFGNTIRCPVNLMRLSPNPLFHGLLGRDTIFREFGFGFWESTNELYVTTTP